MHPLLDAEQRCHDALEAARAVLRARVAALRTAKKLSYRRAAQLLGCDHANLSNLEKGGTWSRPLVERILKKWDPEYNERPDSGSEPGRDSDAVQRGDRDVHGGVPGTPQGTVLVSCPKAGQVE